MEEECGILAAELATGISDADVTLNSPELLTRKTLFKKYTPFTLLQLISRHNNYKLLNGMKQTRSPNPQETLMYQLEVRRCADNSRVHSKSVLAPSEVQGKILASVEILRMMYADQPHIKWLTLCEDMANLVAQKRIERGAGEKPVLRPYNPNQGVQQPAGESDCIMID